MFEKISLHLTIKTSAHDEKMILEATKKNQTNEAKKTKEDEEIFNHLIEQKNNDEKNKLNLKKKLKKQDDINNLIIPMYVPQNINIEEHYLNRIRNKKNKKCSKCGDLFEISSKNNNQNNINICENCLNKDIEIFLRENYL
jgi:hypothetical protein